MLYKSKRFSYTYTECEEEGKNASVMLKEIMDDPEFTQLEEIVVGYWGDVWDDGAAQPLINGMIENKEKFAHIKSLFIGDMDYEESEVSWIMQADYSGIWEALPNLEKLVIKGSSDLKLGEIRHEKLQCLEIICGGLPESIIKSVQCAQLPALEKLLLYIGVEDYGFDGDIASIRELLSQSNFPKLSYLGLTDSEIQDEVAQAVLDSKYIGQITELDLSMGSLTDAGGNLLLERLADYPNVKKLNLEYHYMSDKMMEQLKSLPGVEVNVDDQHEPDNYDGNVYYYPMLTE